MTTSYSPTLVLSQRYSDDSNNLWRAAVECGWNIYRLQGYEVPDDLKAKKKIYIYGESLFVDAIKDQLNIALIQPSNDWLPNLPYKFRMRNICLTQGWLVKRMNNVNLFIKPADNKTFEAKVYSSPMYLEIPDDEAVLVSEAVEFEHEWRAFIGMGCVQVVTSYFKNGKLTLNETDHLKEATEFANEVLRTINDFPRAMAMDVGYIKNKGWAVVEANPIWGSGLYDAPHLDKILDCIKDGTLDWARQLYTDPRWFRP